MTKHIVTGCALLVACFIAPGAPLGWGASHDVGHFQGTKTNGAEMRKPAASRDVEPEGDGLQAGSSLGFDRAGRVFRHAFGDVTGFVHRPPGWDRGKKTGWDGGSMPPGLANKPNSRFAFVRRGPFARLELGVFRNRDVTRLQVANFDRFLDLNPGLERTLVRNPSLVNSQTFLAAHPSLTTWLKAHPQTSEELRENPGSFMNFERRFDAVEAKTAVGSPHADEHVTHREASTDR